MRVAEPAALGLEAYAAGGRHMPNAAWARDQVTPRRAIIEYKALQLWHACVTARSAVLLDDLLADDAVFLSPVVHTPQQGKSLVKLYLAGALQVLGNDSFRYTRQVVQGSTAVLEFETEVDGIKINGVDIITWDGQDRVVEFKVMVRPLKAINLLHQRMAALLEQLKARTDPSHENRS